MKQVRGLGEHVVQGAGLHPARAGYMGLSFLHCERGQQNQNYCKSQVYQAKDGVGRGRLRSLCDAEWTAPSLCIRDSGLGCFE